MILSEVEIYDGDELIIGCLYLIGHITSGDHPIQWGIYERNIDAWTDWETGRVIWDEDDEFSDTDLYFFLPKRMS